MKDCLLTIDSNERFGEDNLVRENFEEVNIGQFCDEDGWINLICQYDDTGVWYNGKKVFDKSEYAPFYRDIVTNDNDDNNVDDDSYVFYKKYSNTKWYYFYCTPSTEDWTEKDFQYLNHRVLMKPNGFNLHKNDTDYAIGNTGAHVHLHFPC